VKLIRTALLVVCGALALEAQLTPEQRTADFQALAANFAKRYGPYEWKRDVLGVDLLKIGSWLDRVAAAKDDLEFYEICIDYVSQLQDAHVGFYLQSDFAASLGFYVDIYEGKPLIYSLSRTRLPAKTYPFEIGDELVSIDGKSAGELLEAFAKYNIGGNPRSTRRFAAESLTYRRQDLMPHAADIGEKATIVIRRQSGELETYEIPWLKTGTPLVSEGPVITPKAGRRPVASRGAQRPAFLDAGDGMERIRSMFYSGLPVPRDVANFGGSRPIFAMPPNFQQRLGSNPYSDAFFSGSYDAGGKTLGFIRIPDFVPSIGSDAAIAQFEKEIAWMRANTDGLIVDVMRNPGGYGYYGIELARRLVARPFRPIMVELRATAELVAMFSYACDYARAIGASQNTMELLTAALKDVRSAYRENRGRTGPITIDGLGLDIPDAAQLITPAVDRSGNVIAYGKPIMILTDEMSFSAADQFPAMLQDNGAAIVFGTRTAGAGGPVIQYNAGAYSEGITSVTIGLMVRKEPIVTPDFPTTYYIENVGVRPDVQEDYMTRDNLMNRGKTFVEDFTGAMVSYILTGRP
jgi:hypothetical protein